MNTFSKLFVSTTLLILTLIALSGCHQHSQEAYSDFESNPILFESNLISSNPGEVIPPEPEPEPEPEPKPEPELSCPVDQSMDTLMGMINEEEENPHVERYTDPETQTKVWRLTEKGEYKRLEGIYQYSDPFSPDGQYLAYSGEKQSDPHLMNYVVKTDGNDDQPIGIFKRFEGDEAIFNKYNWNYGEGVWSKDSKTFYLGTGALKVDVEKREVSPLTPNFMDIFPFHGLSLSPDGQCLSASNVIRDTTNSGINDCGTTYHWLEDNYIDCSDLKLKFIKTDGTGYWEQKIPFPIDGYHPDTDTAYYLDGAPRRWLGNSHITFTSKSNKRLGNQYFGRDYCRDFTNYYCKDSENENVNCNDIINPDEEERCKDTCQKQCLFSSHPVIHVDRNEKKLSFAGSLDTDYGPDHRMGAWLMSFDHMAVSPEAHYLGIGHGWIAGHNETWGYANTQLNPDPLERDYKTVFGKNPPTTSIKHSTEFKSPYYPEGAHSNFSPADDNLYLIENGLNAKGMMLTFKVGSNNPDPNFVVRHRPEASYTNPECFLDENSNDCKNTTKYWKHTLPMLEKDKSGNFILLHKTFSGGDPYPHWSPDGTKIAFHSFFTPNNEAFNIQYMQLLNVAGYVGTNNQFVHPLDSELASAINTIFGTVGKGTQFSPEDVGIDIEKLDKYRTTLERNKLELHKIIDYAMYMAIYEKPKPPTTPIIVDLGNNSVEIRWNPAKHHRETEYYEAIYPVEKSCELKRIKVPVVHTYTKAENPSGTIGQFEKTIEVDSTKEFPSSGVIEVEGLSPATPHELIHYTSKTDTKFLNCTRGYHDTTPSKHWNDSFVWKHTGSHGHSIENITNPQAFWFIVRSVEKSGLKGQPSEIGVLETQPDNQNP